MFSLSLRYRGAINLFKLLDKYNPQQFYRDLHEFDIILSDSQTEQFLMYYELLVEKNQVMNLTAITNFDEVLKKHFVDSLSLVKAYDLSHSEAEISLIDIGTGAGFPGIPIKIAFPNLKVTLMDSLNKRVDFLNEVIETLRLNNIEAIHGRAEDYAKPNQLREKYDLCVSRAVANLSVLSEYCLPYVKTGGKFISYKSEKVSEEISDAEYAINVLGGRIEKQIDFKLPDSDIYRNLVVIEKISETPSKYPRKAGTINKKPLKKENK